MSNVHNCNAVVKNIKALAGKQGHRLSQRGRTTFIDGDRPLDRADLICLDCHRTLVLDMDRAKDGKIRIAGDIDPLKQGERCVPPPLSHHKLMKRVLGDEIRKAVDVSRSKK